MFEKLREILNAYADKGYAEIKYAGVDYLILCKESLKVDSFTYHNNELCVCLEDYDNYNVVPVRFITEIDDKKCN
jgi:hypothetical protein